MKHVFRLFPLLILAAILCITIVSTSNANDNNDAFALTLTDSVATYSDEEEAKPQSEVYNIKRTDDGYMLIANIDGKEVEIGDNERMFGKYSYGFMEVVDFGDFNGDGLEDALIGDYNSGNGGGAQWLIVINRGSGKFDITNHVSNCGYFQACLDVIDGECVLDLVAQDLGKTQPMERYVLRGSKLVEIKAPARESDPPILKTVKIGNMNRGDKIKFDLNDDGKEDKLVNQGDFHFGRSFDVYIGDVTSELKVECLDGNGKLSILQNKTNGVHDLMVTDGSDTTRTLYLWNGKKYELYESE